MDFHVRMLGPGDEETLAVLARDDADFDLADRGEAFELLSTAASRILGNPDVCHWVAEDYGKILGHLYGYRLPTIREEEFLLYEIGVRKACRRQGIGRALVHMMFDWMDAHQVKVAWVIADNSGAEAFYQNLGFRKVEGTLTQLDIRRT